MGSNKELIKRYRQAKKAAHDILNAESSALPDAVTVNQLTNAIFQSDLASGGELFDGPARGGADADQESVLQRIYGVR